MSFDLPSIIGFIIPWTLVIVLMFFDYSLLGWNIVNLIHGDFLNISFYMFFAYLFWFFLRRPFSFFLKVLNKKTKYVTICRCFFGKSLICDPREKMFGKQVLVQEQFSRCLPNRNKKMDPKDIKPSTLFYLVLSRVKQFSSTSILNGIDSSFHQFTLSSKLCTVFVIYIINFWCLLCLTIFQILQLNINLLFFCLLVSYLSLRLAFSLFRKSYLDWIKAVINAFLIL